MACLIVLGNDHGGAPGEVEGEAGLVAAQVLSPENHALGQILLAAPDGPANAGIHQAVPASNRFQYIRIMMYMR